MLYTLFLLQAVQPSFDPGSATAARPLGADAAVQEAESALWWHDYDGDGFADAFAITTAGEARLLRNMGDGSFDDVTATAGLAGVRQARFAQWQDYDGDGRSDLFIGTALGQSLLYKGQRGGGFVESSAAAGIAHAGVDLFAHWLDYDVDGKADLHVRTAGNNWIYHNVGDGVFEAIDLGFSSGTPAGLERPLERGGGSETSAQPTPTESGERSSSTAPDRAARADSAGGRQPVDPAQPFGRSTPGAPQEGLSLLCADQIQDQATATCIQASSVGTLGMLYPLSVDFNVNAAGNVGIGTVAPADQLHVHDGDLRISGNAGREALILDGQNDNAIELDASSNGLSNAIRLFRDGVLSVEYTTATEGHVQRFRNTATNDRVYVAGVSNSDGAGFANVNNDSGSLMINIDGDSDNADNGVETGVIGIRSIGTGGPGGQLQLQSNDGDTRFHAYGGGSAFQDGATLEMFDGVGSRTVFIDADDSSGSALRLYNDDGVATIRNDSDTGPTGAGWLSFSNGTSADSKLALKGSGPGSDLGGEIDIVGADFGVQVHLDGESDNDGGRVTVRSSEAQSTVSLFGDSGEDAGAISLWDRFSSNNNSMQLDARDAFGTGSKLTMRDDDGNQTVEIDASDAGEGEFALWEGDGSRSFRVFNNKLTVYDGNGIAQICMNGSSGAKNAVVQTRSYGQRLLYAVESTEVWFEDVGSAQLSNGQVRIELDAMFLETVTVDEAHPLKVFLTMTGASERVYVEKGTSSFVVRELDGGASDASFDWRVMAKRKGLEDDRLELFDEEADMLQSAADPVVETPHAAISDDESVGAQK